MNRRDFLHPRRLARTAGQVLGALDELGRPEPDSVPSDYALIECGRQAMATTFQVLLPVGTPGGVEAAHEALDEIDRLEAQLTVYREDSEVSRLNRRAAAGPVRVEAGLFGLLEQSAGLTRETEGAFDISVGALIKAWGFYRRQGRVPTPAERS